MDWTETSVRTIGGLIQLISLAVLLLGVRRHEEALETAQEKAREAELNGLKETLEAAEDSIRHDMDAKFAALSVGAELPGHTAKINVAMLQAAYSQGSKIRTVRERESLLSRWRALEAAGLLVGIAVSTWAEEIARWW